MDGQDMDRALERADFALRRITRSLENRRPAEEVVRDDGSARDDELRSKLRDVVAELDQIIREAQN